MVAVILCLFFVFFLAVGSLGYNNLSLCCTPQISYIEVLILISPFQLNHPQAISPPKAEHVDYIFRDMEYLRITSCYHQSY